MTPKSKEQTNGFHHGPYAMGAVTRADVSVTAQNALGETIVVGRFPCTRQIDARAQARAYAVLPDLIKATHDLLRLATHNDIPEQEQNAIKEHALATLHKAGIK